MSGPAFFDVVSAVFGGLLNTILMTVVSFVVGAVLAIPVALMCTLHTRVLRWPAIAFIDITRSIPPLVWVLIVYYGISPVLTLEPLPAAIVALSLISVGYLAENFRAGIANVAKGQREAAAALGLTGKHQFWRIIVPQAINLATPPSTSYAVMLLKDTAIASVIGVADVVFMANTSISQGATAVFAFAVAAVAYLLIGVPLSFLARHVDRIIRAKVVTA